MNKFFAICRIAMLSFVAISLHAQDEIGFPQLLPSYSEDFSNYNSYPSVCFEDVYFDKWGKLWLKTCGGVSGSSGLHLFQFTGYEFKLISGGLTQLKFKDNIGGIYKGEELVGYSTMDDVKQLFFFNLSTHEISFHPIAQAGNFGELFVSADDRIFFPCLKMEQHLNYWNGRTKNWNYKVNLRSRN